MSRPVLSLAGWKWAAAAQSAERFGDPTGRGTPVRLHPNTPPVRDAEHQAKHRKRKIVNASRRRNRRASA